MPSQLKSETARINGAKSQGPKTEEGRARSSQNALKHGLTALKFVLPTEDRDEFYHLRDAYLARFQPADPVEQRLVETMVLCDYRLRRLITIETNLLSNEIVRHGPDPDPLIDGMDDEDRLAWTFQHLATNNPSLQLLSRYQGQIDRAYHRAFRQLQQLQQVAQARGNVAQARGLPRRDSSRRLSPHQTNPPTKPATPRTCTTPLAPAPRSQAPAPNQTNPPAPTRRSPAGSEVQTPHSPPVPTAPDAL